MFSFFPEHETNTVMGVNFKFKVQDSFLEYFWGEIGRFEKQTTLSEAKPTLGLAQKYWIRLDQMTSLG